MNKRQELERIGSLRKSLEPLAVLYQKTVLEPRKEPFEVRLTTQQSADHLSEDYYGEDTVHIIDGESLKAVHEVWQEYRQTEKQLLEQIGQAPGSENNGKGSLDSLTYLSAPERAWLEWFYYLSDEDKRIVEKCGENDISVTADNLEQMREIAKDQAANSSGSVVPLFKY
jgi:hypothetical protein